MDYMEKFYTTIKLVGIIAVITGFFVDSTNIMLFGVFLILIVINGTQYLDSKALAIQQAQTQIEITALVKSSNNRWLETRDNLEKIYAKVYELKIAYERNPPKH
jgi:hypothetical protein